MFGLNNAQLIGRLGADATLDQLRHLKLHGMARAFAELNDNPQAGELDHGQWLALLLDREEAERDDRRLTYRLRNARLRHPEACIEDVDYRASRRLDKALFQQLARGKWIAGKQNLIVTGPCGVGKSWLACALGQKACRDDFSVLYKRVPRMFAELETGRADGRYPRLFRALTKANLLILDDWEPDKRRDGFLCSQPLHARLEAVSKGVEWPVSMWFQEGC